MKDPLDYRRMTRSIEEHAFALAVGYTDGAWLELARRDQLKATLLDEGVRLRWEASRRKGPRRAMLEVDAVKFRATADDTRAQAMVDLAFRAPRWKVFA